MHGRLDSSLNLLGRPLDWFGADELGGIIARTAIFGFEIQAIA